MKIIQKLNINNWSIEGSCHCKTTVEVGINDLKIATYKISGYWFDGSAQTEDKAFVSCPVCKDDIVFRQTKLPEAIWINLPRVK